MTKVKPMLRVLTRDDVTVTIRTEPEEVSPRGYFATDEPEQDRLDEDAIMRRIDAGDEWAWCIVIVEVTWDGFTGRDTLGACSYTDEDDFRAGGYFDDMVDLALHDLNRQVSATYESIKPLILTSEGAP